MEDWQRYGYASYEAFISSKAGACPPCNSGEVSETFWDGFIRTFEPGDWPQELPPPFTPPDDEGRAEPGARDE